MKLSRYIEYLVSTVATDRASVATVLSIHPFVPSSS